jgi:hypothetical protein
MTFGSSFLEMLRWRSALISVAVLSAVASDPSAAYSVTLSGTVCYSGSQGPVSAERPIELIVSERQDKVEGHGFYNEQYRVAENCGHFQFSVPAAGNYYLFYALGIYPGGNTGVGAPYELYNNRCAPVDARDPIPVPPSSLAGASLDFDDTCILPGIGGTVTYTGQRGVVSSESPLGVQMFDNPEFRGDPVVDTGHDGVQSNGGRYDLIIGPGTYYLRALFDLNGSRDGWDPTEPFGTCGPVSPNQTAMHITFDDTGAATCRSCVGDCNGDGEVTINEIILLVNIALGNTPLSACTAGDADARGTIEINEIIIAVNNALSGCPGR